MTEHDPQQHLYDLLGAIPFAGDDAVDVPPELCDEESGIARVSSFAEAGLLTSNADLVLRMRDGGEFQLTIVAST